MVSTVGSPHADSFSEVPFEREVPLFDNRVLEVDLRSQIEEIRARLRDIRRVGIGKGILWFSIHQVVVGKERYVAGSDGPTVNCAATHQSLDKSSVTAAQHGFVVAPD